MGAYPLLFSPRTLGSKTARNRIVSTSHGTNMAVDGAPGDALIAYHAAKAQGGCGVVMMFGGAAASSLTPVPNNHVNLWQASAEPGLRRAAAAVKGHGALALSQIACLGRRTNLHADIVGRGPSDTVSEVAPNVPHVLTTGEIRRFVEDYASAAARLAGCGFDGCDLAFYGDQLPDQFWDPSTNKRTDRYGGSLENRMRFSLDILRAVRQAVGPGFVVGARISADDRVPGGLDSEALHEIAIRLDRERVLDYFLVTAGTIQTYRSRGLNIPSLYYPHDTFGSFARSLRKVLNVPIIVTGRIVTPEEAEGVLERGEADMVGMTRALIADPELPRKTQEGRRDQIRVCMGTSEGCIDRLYMGMPIACVQNPVIGREREWSELLPAKTRKRVVVVGAGPAGLEAARVAALRGHEVIVFERRSEVGGAIRVASRAPEWSAYTGVIEWLEREVRRSGVDLRLDTEATSRAILEFEPGAVVIATGAKPRRPYLAGAELPHAITIADALGGAAKVGKRCVILDETGYTPGPKTADMLAANGHRVQIVTRQYSLGEDIGTTLRAALHERLLRAGVEITPLSIPVEVTARGVRIAHTLTDEVREIEADTVIFSSGGLADDALYNELHATFDALHLIGDAFAPRHLRHAMSDGARIGREL